MTAASAPVTTRNGKYSPMRPRVRMTSPQGPAAHRPPRDGSTSRRTARYRWTCDPPSPAGSPSARQRLLPGLSLRAWRRVLSSWSGVLEHWTDCGGSGSMSSCSRLRRTVGASVADVGLVRIAAAQVGEGVTGIVAGVAADVGVFLTVDDLRLTGAMRLHPGRLRRRHGPVLGGQPCGISASRAACFQQCCPGRGSGIPAGAGGGTAAIRATGLCSRRRPRPGIHPDLRLLLAPACPWPRPAVGVRLVAPAHLADCRCLGAAGTASPCGNPHFPWSAEKPGTVLRTS